MRFGITICAVMLVSSSVVANTNAVENSSPTMQPLALAGQDLQAINQALISLSRGDTKDFEALPIEAFLNPVARPDPVHSGLSFRWTLALPTVLKRLPETERAAALQRLDARYLTLLHPDFSTRKRTQLAISFIPAPTALKTVQHAANIAFDHGQLIEYLGITNLLPQPTAIEKRHDVALQLTGLGPDIDTVMQLRAPGSAQSTNVLSTTTTSHLAVQWVNIPGWIFALDPFDQIIWQYRVDRNATVISGPGAVLVRDSQGLRSLNDSGQVQHLTPLPKGAQILSVAGGAGWFATGNIGWRLSLTEGKVTALSLHETPFGAPIVRGEQSLWLTDRSFILFENNKEIHRYRHQLPVGIGWQLRAQESQPHVVAPDGRHWRITQFAEQLAQGSPQQKAQLFIAANRFDEALTVLADAQDAESHSLKLRAHIGLAQLKDKPLPSLQADPEMAVSDRALLLSAYFSGKDDGISHITSAQQSAFTDLYSAMDNLVALHPQVVFSATQETLIDNSDRWNQLFTALAWENWRQTPLSNTSSIDPQTRIGAPQTDSRTINNHATRDEDGALLWLHQRYKLSRTPDAITVACHNQSNKLLWKNRWRPGAFVSAPSQNMDIRNGYVYVQEGDTRIIVLDALLGIRVGNFPIINANGTPYYLPPNQLAMLGPLGVNDSLTILQENGQQQIISLPETARWSFVIGNQLVVRLIDNTIIAYPRGIKLDWPTALRTLKNAPSVSLSGIHDGVKLWPWVK